MTSPVWNLPTPPVSEAFPLINAPFYRMVSFISVNPYIIILLIITVIILDVDSLKYDAKIIYWTLTAFKAYQLI